MLTQEYANMHSLHACMLVPPPQTHLGCDVVLLHIRITHTHTHTPGVWCHAPMPRALSFASQAGWAAAAAALHPLHLQCALSYYYYFLLLLAWDDVTTITIMYLLHLTNIVMHYLLHQCRLHLDTFLVWIAFLLSIKIFECTHMCAYNYLMT